MKRQIYQEIASRLEAIQNCIQSNNQEWLEKHRDAIGEIMKNAPSGSGIDCGTKFDIDASNPNKLVFTASFHHMNDNGMYDGWTEHKLVVTPQLANGFSLQITGRNRNQIKDYLHDVYLAWLSSEV